MKKSVFLLCLLALVLSCTKDPENTGEYNSSDNGVFILNEGNFGGGTGSLSFWSYSRDTIYNGLFELKNGWPLGDVAFSMYFKGDKAYIVVNNSGKIEVINKNSIQSVATISGLNSPRNISFIDVNRALVTSMYSDSVAVINLVDNSISGYIDVNHTSESIVTIGEKAYVANWIGGNKIMVVNTRSSQLVDSILVGMEPESMVKDKNNKLWVLCNGGWARQNYAELVRINPLTDEIEQTFTFPAITDSPSCLQSDGKGENLYFIEKGIRKMSIDASSLPSSALIPESGQYFYKIGVNPVNGDIFATDALDYQQKGNVMRYDVVGQLLSTKKADIIPAFMCFRFE